jgi:hypothetical protein
MLQNGKQQDIASLGEEKGGRGKGRDKGKRKTIWHRQYISPDKWKKLS